jgi:coenzyme F420-0:L-glutamate ligase
MAYSVFGMPPGLILPGDSIVNKFLDAAMQSLPGSVQNGDIIVIAESALATAEGRIVALASITPSRRAISYADAFQMDPRLVEVVLSESDSIVGGVSGFLLCMKNGTLLPNAGVDRSNAPDGCVVLLPADPDGSAGTIRELIQARCVVRVAVIVADSRVHAIRSGCSGVAIGCAGIESVIEERGRVDLFGKPLQMTRRAVADLISSAAEIVMGEADEGIPFTVLRGLGLPMTDDTGVRKIHPSDCYFMNSLGEQVEVRKGAVDSEQALNGP